MNTPVNPLGWIMVIVLIGGVAWAWQRYAYRKQRYQLDEERCRRERDLQQERERRKSALHVVNSRNRK